MAGPVEVKKFDPLIDDERALVVERMQAMLDAHDGWLNLEPDVPDDTDLPPAGGVFSAKGPPIPLCTWTPPPRSRKGVVGPQSLGVQHGRGSKARPHLDEVNLPVPTGWLVRSDHPKRGMVLELPSGTDPDTALDWILAAGEALAVIPVTGRWHAAFYAG
jgi:hypothetical protein